MSFWKNLFGSSKQDNQIMESPEHELAKTPPDDLMVIKDKQKDSSHLSGQETDQMIHDIDKEKENWNNKDSP